MFKTKLNNFVVSGINEQEYHLIKKEIFGKNIYYFDLKKDKQTILDLGSHIGVSILYFKEHYPNAEIVGFEPNPFLFEILKNNIFENNLVDVDIYNKAVSDSEQDLTLHIDQNETKWYSTGGYLHGGWSGKQTTREIKVDSVRLSSLLNKNIDLLKVDIEGMELRVLQESKDLLKNVRNIVVEYHPDQKKKLKKLINLLSSYFKLEVFYEGVPVSSYDENSLLIIKGKSRS